MVTYSPDEKPIGWEKLKTFRFSLELHSVSDSQLPSDFGNSL